MVYLAYPEEKHYEAYLQACQTIVEYIQNNKNNDVERRESAGFEFAHNAGISKENFAKLVSSYKQSREVDLQKKESSAYPQICLFIMEDDKIIGTIGAHAKHLKEADIKEGVKPIARWSSEQQQCKADTSTMMLPEYRGKGLNKEIKKQFFDILRNDYEIFQVTATVMRDNENSNRAQNKLIERYGGKFYTKEMASPSGTTVCNSYIISTDTSGNSKDLYQVNKNTEKSATTTSLAKKLKELRGTPRHYPISHPSKKTEINPATLKYVQFQRQNN